MIHRRVAAVVACVASAVAVLAAAAADIKVNYIVAEGRVGARFTASDHWTPNLREQLQTGSTVTFDYVAELRRPATLWPDAVLARTSVTAAAKLDTLIGGYTVSRQRDGRIVRVERVSQEAEVRDWLTSSTKSSSIPTRRSRSTASTTSGSSRHQPAARRVPVRVPARRRPRWFRAEPTSRSSDDARAPQTVSRQSARASPWPAVLLVGVLAGLFWLSGRNGEHRAAAVVGRPAVHAAARESASVAGAAFRAGRNLLKLWVEQRQARPVRQVSRQARGALLAMTDHSRPCSCWPAAVRFSEAVPINGSASPSARS
jgi:hypothetical protein